MRTMRSIMMLVAAIGLGASAITSAYAQVCASVRVCEPVEILGVEYPDSDCDGVPDLDENGFQLDNCRCAPNGSCETNPEYCNVNMSGSASEAERAVGYQIDSDRDGIGDACEDEDLDGVDDWRDNCPGVPNGNCSIVASCDIDGDGELGDGEIAAGGQMDVDGDGAGDACMDTDGDGIYEPVDNCPAKYNPEQEDYDGDGFGDWCDTCRFVANADQDPTVCPYEERQMQPRFPPPAPSGGVGFELGPDWQRGGGGCHLAANVPASPLAAILLAASIAAIAVRRKF